MSALIGERFVEIDGIRLFVRERSGAGPPTVFLHGNPTNSADWIPFLEAHQGAAIAPDLPGFGRSERPDPGRFDYSVGAYGRFLDLLFAELAPDGYRLVVHDWGVVGLVAAQLRPERLQRLVVINAVPLNGDYRWHWVARLWRRRGVGEALIAATTRSGTEAMLRLARPGHRPMPEGFVDMVMEHFDAGTGRAVLRLYRSADPSVLAAAGEHLGHLDCPALVVWGEADPYMSADEGRTYARQLPRAGLVELHDAGHWPWIDRPDVVAFVVDFLEGEEAAP